MVRKAVGLWSEPQIRVTMSGRVGGLSRVGLEIPPCVLFLMSMLGTVGFGESSIS